jgi:hypothetical protein
MNSLTRLSFALMTALVLSVCFSSTHTVFGQLIGSSKIIISEFRLDGPNGPGDEFVEIVNNANFTQTIVSSDAFNLQGWSVWGLVAGNATKICTIPFGTTLAAGQHFLCTKVPDYELGGYSQGQDDNIANYTPLGLDADGGVALFSSTTVAIAPNGTFSSSTSSGTVYREDAVGFKNLNSATSSSPFAPAFWEPYVIGPSVGLKPIGPQDPAHRAPNTPNDVREYSFVRKHGAGAFATWTGPIYQDTNINTADWILVSNVGDLRVDPTFVNNSATNTSFPGTPFDPSPVGFPGSEFSTTPIFGAPGPQSKASPIERNHTTKFIRSLFDPFFTAAQAPNRFQNPPPVCGGPNGELILRFTYKNLTGLTQNNLRVRWIDLSTINRGNPNYTAVLDLLDSTPPAVKTLLVVLTRDLASNDPWPTGDGITNASPPGGFGLGIKRVRGTYVEGVYKTPTVSYFATAPPPGFGGPFLGPGSGPAIQVFTQVNPTWTYLVSGTPCRIGGLNSATVATPPAFGVTTTALPAPIVPGGSISLEHRFGIIGSGGFVMMGIIESN